MLVSACLIRILRFQRANYVSCIILYRLIRFQDMLKWHPPSIAFSHRYLFILRISYSHGQRFVISPHTAFTIKPSTQHYIQRLKESIIDILSILSINSLS